jgi:hypothetical protein
MLIEEIGVLGDIIVLTGLGNAPAKAKLAELAKTRKLI